MPYRRILKRPRPAGVFRLKIKVPDLSNFLLLSSIAIYRISYNFLTFLNYFCKLDQSNPPTWHLLVIQNLPTTLYRKPLSFSWEPSTHHFYFLMFLDIINRGFDAKARFLISPWWVSTKQVNSTDCAGPPNPFLQTLKQNRSEFSNQSHLPSTDSLLYYNQ